VTGFRHAALIVDSDETLRYRLVPRLRKSIERNAPVLMVVGADTERMVRAEFGASSDRLDWGDPGAFHQRLGFAFEGFRTYLAAQHAAGRQVHVVAEPDLSAGVSRDIPFDRAWAYLSFEAMCNSAYAGFGCPITCIYDSRRQPDRIIGNVRTVHDHEVTADGDVVNDRHVPPAEFLAGRNEVPLSAPPRLTDLDLPVRRAEDLGDLARAVASWAGSREFADQAIDDVVTAVAEIATNGLVHGEQPVRVRAWWQGDTLVAQVDDAGGRPLPALAGYVAPRTDPDTGRGLWLARQLADAVSVHTEPRMTSVRLHFPHEVTHRNPA
jgi:anti-sigma regulatory factor (Ser/Thr protein kinase)